MKLSPREPKVEKEYEKWLEENKGGPCAFCNFPNWQKVKEYKHFIIVKNRFPYKDWFGHKVSNHLMLIPKRHVELFHQLTKEELDEYMQIIIEFDNDAYSSHTKNMSDPNRSIRHLHTHLFKVID